MRPFLTPGLRTRRFNFSTSSSNIASEIRRVRAALADALEATNFIAASAQQAYLEADPAARGQPESYTARYKAFACSQAEEAIAAYDKLSSALGEKEMKELKGNESLGLAVADTLLARDHLKASLREDQERMERKISRGLQKEDLVFCDGPS